MAVLSIFAYGSDQHGRTKGRREATKTFTTAFSDACEGKKLVIDGPGTLGLEVEENTKEGVRQILSWLDKQPDAEEYVVNMSGFSRGSITCIRMANALKRIEYLLVKSDPTHKNYDERMEFLEKIRKIKINMYLMDPVTGPLERRPKHARVIPDNVKSCVITYQKDERRHDMTPQDMKRIIVQSPEKTQVSMLPLYGNHSDTTRIKSEAMASGSRLNWYFLHAFFNKHGTKFNKDKIPPIIYSDNYVDINNQLIPDKPDEALTENPSAAELLELFSQHHENREAHLKSGLRINFFDSAPIARYERSLNKDAKFYVKDPDFFVNQLERELFKIAYPRTFNYLFEHNIYDSRSASNSLAGQVKEELAKLEDENEHLFKRLKTRGVSSENKRISLGDPCGYKYLEPCATVRQVIPRLIPPSHDNAIQRLGHSPEQLDKLPLLEMEIYRRTFEYERKAFRGRSLKADWANKIRQETHDIISRSNGDREATRQLVLDKLEENYKALIRSNSNSRLNGVLKTILADNEREIAITKGSLSNEVLVEFIDHQFKLVKSTLHLVSLIAGYERGYHLDTLGRWLENWGKRVEECLGEVGYNPFKFVALILAKTLEGIGVVVKNGFGLKPICDFWLEFVEKLRVAALETINETQVTKTSDITKESKIKLQAIVGEDRLDQPSTEDDFSANLNNS